MKPGQFVFLCIFLIRAQSGQEEIGTRNLVKLSLGSLQYVKVKERPSIAWSCLVVGACHAT